MRIFFVLALFAAGFVNSASVQAQPWQIAERVVEDEDDPSKDGLVALDVFTLAPNGIVGVNCLAGELTLGAGFGGIETGPEREVTVTWRINNGTPMEFRSLSSGDSYTVLPPLSVELARLLVEARQFVTSNGADEVMLFENLTNGDNIDWILEACGH